MADEEVTETTEEEPDTTEEPEDEGYPEGTVQTGEGTEEDIAEANKVRDAFGNEIPEGLPYAPVVDPAAEGDDALAPDWDSAWDRNLDGTLKADPYSPLVPDAEVEAAQEALEARQEEAAAEEATEEAPEAPSEPEAPEAPAEPPAEPEAPPEAPPEPEPEVDPTPGDEGGPFDASKDPADYTVAEVTAFLSTASEEDRATVVAAEAAGRNRKGIVEF